MRVWMALLLLGLLSACKKNNWTAAVEQPELYSVEQINERVYAACREKGKMEWSAVDDHLLWSAIAHSDSVVAVGYQPRHFQSYPGWLSAIDLQSSAWRYAKEQVIAETLSAGGRLMEIWPEHFLPVVLLRISGVTDLYRLRNSPFVRYVEPLSYDRNLWLSVNQTESSSGCGSNTPNWDLRSGVHYTSIAPLAKQSWNYVLQGIPRAWNRSSGKGIKVFVIDTGCSWGQENLGVTFNTGASFGRSLERIVTLPPNTVLGIPVGLPETSHDGCGHGTSMAGVVGAPRGVDGNAVGIAYNCDLITCRAASDVFLDEPRELKGVVDAFTQAANRSEVRVISMSMGRITSSSYLADAIRYAHGKGKLIFAAAGTSFEWTAGWTGVIFPASLPEVQAVTGVKSTASLVACKVCHKGPEVDFVVTMENSSDGMYPLSLADAGDWPSTVGGSSVATASMAGMAALVWSRFPRLSRDQLLSRLQRHSSSYPRRSLSFGWGRLNVDAATR